MANSNSNKMPVLDLEREEKREENGECVVEKERKARRGDGEDRDSNRRRMGGREWDKVERKDSLEFEEEVGEGRGGGREQRDKKKVPRTTETKGKLSIKITNNAE